MLDLILEPEWAFALGFLAGSGSLAAMIGATLFWLERDWRKKHGR